MKGYHDCEKKKLQNYINTIIEGYLNAKEYYYIIMILNSILKLDSNGFKNVQIYNDLSYL